MGPPEGHNEGWQVEMFPYFLELLCPASGALKMKALNPLKIASVLVVFQLKNLKKAY